MLTYVDSTQSHLVDVLRPFLLAVPHVRVGMRADVVLVCVLDRPLHCHRLELAAARPGGGIGVAATPLVPANRQAARISCIVSDAVRKLGHAASSDFDFATRLRQRKAQPLPVAGVIERQVEDLGGVRPEVAAGRTAQSFDNVSSGSGGTVSANSVS